MKKTIIILIALVCVNSLLTTVLTQAEKEDMKANVHKRFEPIHTYFDGLLQSTIEYSQEDYQVGDIVDITIHYEVNTVKNVDNLKFAILDFSLRRLQYQFDRNPEKITQEIYDMKRNRFIDHLGPLEFIECDPDLVLTNNNPNGDYHLKFKLIKKTKGIKLFDIRYPYIDTALDMYTFKEKKEYEFITIYPGEVANFPIYIEINPTSLITEEENDSNQNLLPDNEKKSLELNKLEYKLVRGRITMF